MKVNVIIKKDLFCNSLSNAWLDEATVETILLKNVDTQYPFLYGLSVLVRFLSCCFVRKLSFPSLFLWCCTVYIAVRTPGFVRKERINSVFYTIIRKIYWLLVPTLR